MSPKLSTLLIVDARRFTGGAYLLLLGLLLVCRLWHLPVPWQGQPFLFQVPCFASACTAMSDGALLLELIITSAASGGGSAKCTADSWVTLYQQVLLVSFVPATVKRKSR